MSIPMTEEGISRLDDEINNLISVKRREISVSIGLARESGGELSENVEYQNAKDAQIQNEMKIAKLSKIKINAVPIKFDHNTSSMVGFGATVTVVNEDTEKENVYQIVSEYEADISKGLLSYTSPIGKSMIDKEIGDSIEVLAPSGNKYYEIINVEYR